MISHDLDAVASAEVIETNAVITSKRNEDCESS